MRILPFAVILALGMVGVTYAVDGTQYSCRWTIVGYVCPDLAISAN